MATSSRSLGIWNFCFAGVRSNPLGNTVWSVGIEPSRAYGLDAVFYWDLYSAMASIRAAARKVVCVGRNYA